MTTAIRITLIVIALCFGCSTVHAETPEQWVTLLTRVHGGFGSFLPVGIRIGEDAMKRLDAKPRELDVTFYQGEGTPCPCAADGVSLAVYASAGQGTLHIAAERSPPFCDGVHSTAQGL
jgi:formylmethanofuran dehydrogenase subunit E